MTTTGQSRWSSLAALLAGGVFMAVATGFIAASGPAPKLVARHGRAVIGAGGLFRTAGLGMLAIVVSVIGVTGSGRRPAPRARRGGHRHRPRLHADRRDHHAERRPSARWRGFERRYDDPAARLRTRCGDHGRDLCRAHGGRHRARLRAQLRRTIRARARPRRGDSAPARLAAARRARGGGGNCSRSSSTASAPSTQTGMMRANTKISKF